MKIKILKILVLSAISMCSSVYAVYVSSEPYGKTSNGEEVLQFTLKNKEGMVVKAISYGGIVTDIIVPDKFGNFENVTLNLQNLADYEANRAFFGPIIGRYGNRIGKAEFSIDGIKYNISVNENQNALHGGQKGFDCFVWKAEMIEGKNEAGIKFTRTSPDGEMGFPGNMQVEVIYKLNENNEFSVSYKAQSDKKTVCNLTWHPFLNLAGAGNGTILTHHFFVPADYVTLVDKELIPTGENMPVTGTPFDFTLPNKAIGERLNKNAEQVLKENGIERNLAWEQGMEKLPKEELYFRSRVASAIAQLKNAGGAYDHNFVLNKPVDTMGVACIIYHPKSGRKLTVQTEEPCLQFYSGQGFNGKYKGANGKSYEAFAGFVIEPQHYPDAPNKPQFFPSTLLLPGEVFTSKSIYKFSTDPNFNSYKKGSLKSILD